MSLSYLHLFGRVLLIKVRQIGPFFSSWENHKTFGSQKCYTLFHTENEEKSQKISTCICIHTCILTPFKPLLNHKTILYPLLEMRIHGSTSFIGTEIEMLYNFMFSFSWVKSHYIKWCCKAQL